MVLYIYAVGSCPLYVWRPGVSVAEGQLDERVKEGPGRKTREHGEGGMCRGSGGEMDR